MDEVFLPIAKGDMWLIVTGLVVLAVVCITVAYLVDRSVERFREREQLALWTAHLAKPLRRDRP